MKYIGMTVLAAGLAMTAAYFFGAQSVGQVVAGTASCSFDVNAVNGIRAMRSKLTSVVDAATPGGPTETSGFTHVLRVNLSAEAGCEPVTLEKWVGTLEGTDYGNRKWLRQSAIDGVIVVDAETEDVVSYGAASKISSSEVQFTFDGFVINSGETVTLDFYLSTAFADDELDDTATFSLKENSFQWNDGFKTVREMNPRVGGTALVF